MLNNNMLPDIIISDVMMPDMDGIELCRQIKSNMYMAHIPIILLTAKTGATNAMKGYELGANIYMEKPFSSSMLLMLQVFQIRTISPNASRRVLVYYHVIM